MTETLDDIDRQIEAAVQGVADQRALIKKRRMTGSGVGAAEHLLFSMIEHLNALRQDRARLHR